MEKYLIFQDDKSNKFWRVRTEDNRVVVTFGKIGTAGQIQEKIYPNAVAAEKDALSQMNSKLKKGYQEADALAAAPAANSSAVREAKPAKTKQVKVDAGNGAATASDDGEAKPWHSNEYEGGDWFFYYEEGFNNLENPAEDDEKLAKPAPVTLEVSNEELGVTEDDDEDDIEAKREAYRLEHHLDEQIAQWRERFADKNYREGHVPKKPVDERLIDWLVSQIGDNVDANYSYQKAEPQLKALRMLIKDEDKYKAALEKALEPGIEDILQDGGDLDKRDKARLIWLLHRGAVIDKSLDTKEPLRKYIKTEYLKNPDPERIDDIVKTWVNSTMKELTPKFAEAVKAMVSGIADGTLSTLAISKEESCELTLDNIPRFNMTPNSIYPFINRREGNAFYRYPFERNESIDFDDVLAALDKALPATLREMAERGDFDCAKDKLPVLAVGQHRGRLWLRHVLDEKFAADKAATLESLVKYLEEDGDIAAHKGSLTEGICALLNGVFLPIDEERANKILQKHLYGLDGEVMDEAYNLYSIYKCYGYDSLSYAYANWDHMQRPDTSWGHSDMEKLAEKGYPGAKEALAAWHKEDVEREARNKAFKEAAPASKSDGKTRKPTEANFHEIFSESDVFLNTGRVIARAYPSSRIMIRFKIEGEEAYSETLDWLINLLEKRYADIDGGYEIHVRFLMEPIFIKQFLVAQTECHAFFARAITYPALREKVKSYAERALNLFDWYKDIDGEENCVTGTFAAIGLAFAEEKYVPLVGLFGRNSDDEHQYIQLEVAAPLFKQYGATAEVAAALYDIQSSNGQDGDIRLNKALLTTPVCLQGVMEHVHQGELGSWAAHHLDYHVPGYVEAIWGDNVKSNLKKFKQFAEGAASAEDRNIFTDFYNFYKKYASQHDKADYGDDLEGVSDIKKSIVLPNYASDPIISVEEAEKEGLWYDDEGWDDKRGIVFFPAIIDNPEVYDYICEQWDVGCKAARDVAMSFYWGDANTNADKYGAIRVGKWVFDLGRLPERYGMILFDGKRKPYVLYGLMNTVAISTRWASRPFKTPEEAEALRQSMFIGETPPYQRLTSQEEFAFDDKFDKAFSAVWNNHYWLAATLLSAYEPKHGRYYDAALYLRARVARERDELVDVAALYDELAARRPEFADYLAKKRAELGKK